VPYMEQDLFATYKKDRNVLKIYYDTHPESPREWDNLGTMICWHRRYNLGDNHSYSSPSDFWYAMAEEFVGDSDKVENMTKERREEIVRKNVMILPLYLYDHSGITMRTYPFG